MSIYSNLANGYARDLGRFADSTKKDYIITTRGTKQQKIWNSQGYLERRLDAYIVARIAAPLFAVIHAADASIELSLMSAEHLIGGTITADVKQIKHSVSLLGEAIITPIVFALIGAAGIVSPKFAASVSKPTREGTYHKIYGPLSGRIMSLVLTILSPARTLSAKTRAGLVSLFTTVSDLATSVISKPLYGLHAALTMNPTSLTNLGILARP